MDNARYVKQICLPEVGEAGQQKLASACVSVIGAGGLGSPVIYYLAAAGVGTIHIIESDVVEISNLNRQLLHFERDTGVKKAVSAKEKINAFNSDVNIEISDARINDSNAHELLRGSDIVLCCADNFETRRAVNKACVGLGIPLADGGVGAFTGYCLTVLPGQTPCYECIFGGAKQKSSGVIGAAAGVIGSMMALQALKLLLGMREGMGLVVADFKSMNCEKISVSANAECPVCGHGV